MSRFDIRQGFERGIRRQAEYGKSMRGKTAIVRRTVLAVAPDRSGHYKKKVQQRGTLIIAADIAWHLIEFGSAKNPAYGPLRRGVIAAGLRFEPSPR